LGLRRRHYQAVKDDRVKRPSSLGYESK
jgi:hypothetical protein